MMFEKQKKGAALPLAIRTALFLIWCSTYFVTPLVRRRSFKPATVNKVLVIQLKSLGDVIFITPALKALRKNLPTALISVLTKPITKEILANNPYVDDILTTDVEYGGEVKLSDLVGLIRSLRQQKFDLVFDFTGDFWFSSWLAYFTGAQYRVGSSFVRQVMNVFRLNGSGWLITHEVPADVSVYPPQYFLDQLRFLGMTVEDEGLSLSIRKDEAKFVMEFLKDRGISLADYVVLIHPGAGWNSKKWPVDSYAQLADYLIENYQLTIIFTGIEPERGLINSILSRMRHKSYPIVVDFLSLKQFVALIARCQLVISNDTSALHIAVAFGVRSVSLFGPTSAQHLVPCDERYIGIQSFKECSPCFFFNRRGFEPKCPFDSHAECMKEIRIDVVKEAVLNQLSDLGVSRVEETKT